MSALTRLAAVRTQERELLALMCAACKHPLRDHSLIHSLSPTGVPKGRGSCRGKFMGPRCECGGWQEPS